MGLARASSGSLHNDQALAVTATNVLDVYTGTAAADTFSAPGGSVNWTICGLDGDNI